MKKTILLVEYDNPVIESIADLFSGEGFEFSKVEDGEAAKKILEKKRFDLVITAAMLPKFHGFYLSQHIKELFPTTSVIIISGVFKGYEYRQQAMTQYQADDYFEKPLDLVKLKKRAYELINVMEDAEQFDPSVTQIPKAKTNKIPTLKTLEQEQNKLTSDDIFGDILKKIESSSPGVKIDLEQPKAPPVQHPNPTITDRSDLLKELVTLEEPSRVSPTVLLKKPVNLDSMVQTGTQDQQPKKEYKKLEDEISKKFEETLSGLGLSAKPSAPRPQPTKPEPPPVILSPMMAQPKIQKTETGEEVGGYEILGPIARGGMAEIYKAKKKGVKGFEKIIALKKILSGYGEDQKYIEMFVDEAKIAAQLTHPNIVQIYDLGRKDDYYFIAMEYVEGKDLRLLLRQLSEKEKYLPLELSIYMIIKVLEALYYAHTAKDNRGQTLDIVHRDVSPPNILIGYTGEIKLTDFGVSKASIKMHQTISGALKGKLLYMSPEQAKGDRNIDCRSDIFSAGVIFFEMLTNKKLFLDESEMQVLKKVQEGDITMPSSIRKDIDPELEAILIKSLQKDPKARYQNAIEMAEALSAYLQKNYTQSPSPAHITHYLATLFADDIRKNNIKIELKKEPYQITRKPSPVVEKPVEAPKVQKAEPEKKTPQTPPIQTKPSSPPPPATIKVVPQPPAPSTQKIPVPPAKPQDPKPSIRSDEEFSAMEDRPIEIDLNSEREAPRQPTESNKVEKKSEPPKPLKEEPAVEPMSEPSKKSEKATSYHEELALLDKESSSKKKIYLIVAAAIVVVVGLYIIFAPGSGTSSPDSSTASVSKPLDHSVQGTITESQATGDPSENQNPLTPEPQTDASANPEEASSESVASQTVTPPPTSNPESEKQAASTAQPVPAKQTQQSTVTPPQPQEKKPEPQSQKPTVQPPQEKKTETAKPVLTQTNATDRKESQKTADQPPKPVTTPPPTGNTEMKEEKKEEPVEETKPPETIQAAPVQKPVEKPEPRQITEGMELLLNELDIQPQKLNTPDPDIPRKALKSLPANTSVLARILVNHKGQVERVVMSKKTNVFDADMAIISTLSKWTFQPGRKDNVAVKVWLTIPITLN